ncbi:MAG TPA: hypothetical protein VMU19_08280 [Bryobacteraceae bacterium]|nr:hypothetical protein [Bryobacteraceae bacterium]
MTACALEGRPGSAAGAGEESGWLCWASDMAEAKSSGEDGPPLEDAVEIAWGAVEGAVGDTVTPR